MTKEALIELQKDKLRRSFERRLPKMAERRWLTNVQQIIPDGFFAAASTECREMFVGGHFYGCISLCQAVAEGLSKMVANVCKSKKGKDFSDRVDRLLRQNLITREVAEAFHQTHGKDRDDFHHLNSDVEQDVRKLEARANGCLNALYQIEKELFAHGFTDDGGILPKHPKYWPKADATRLRAYIREL
jgi:hypothetical protein